MVPPPADIQRLLRMVGTRRGLRKVLERLTFELLDYFRSTVPVWLPLMTHPAFRFEEFARRHPESGMSALRRDLMAFLAAQRDAGRIANVDPGGAAMLLIATAHSVAIFERLGAHEGRFPPVIVHRAVECLWEGMRPKSAKTRRGAGITPRRTGRTGAGGNALLRPPAGSR
jgi:hypothetical protein